MKRVTHVKKDLYNPKEDIHTQEDQTDDVSEKDSRQLDLFPDTLEPEQDKWPSPQ